MTEKPPTRKTRTLTWRDAGCYADGAFGEARVRSRLRAILLDLVTNPGCAVERDDIASRLASADDEVAGEAMEEAVEMLNDQVVDGVLFELDAGDLLLVGDENESDGPMPSRSSWSDP